MTEQEWLACNDPLRMLRFLRAEPNARKPLLLACACVSRIQAMLDDHARRWVAVAEAVADGKIDVGKLPDESCETALSGLVDNGMAHAVMDIFMVGWQLSESELQPGDASWALERCKQALVVREIFGNPFRPIPANTSWLTSTVVTLAQAIYDERAFDQLPILADALEDAGCGNADILNHCRQPGEHVRGCWLVDLLLGKQ